MGQAVASLIWIGLAGYLLHQWRLRINSVPMEDSQAHSHVSGGFPKGDPMRIPIFPAKQGGMICMDKLLPTTITKSYFQRCLDLYPRHVRDVYQYAETQRFDVIPEQLEKRRKMGPRYLKKKEVLDLDRWIQKRGIPLKQEAHRHNEHLIKHNNDENVKRVTEEALERYTVDNPFPAMEKLKKDLQGVGLARASLLLSTAYPDTMPFFSWELYQWALWFPEEGWSRQYNPEARRTQGSSLLEVIQSVRNRLGQSAKRPQAVEVEKVVFVLMRECRVAHLRLVELKVPANAESIGNGATAFVHVVDRLKGLESEGKVAVKRIPILPSLDRSRLFGEFLDSSDLAMKSPEHFVKFFGWNEDRYNVYIAMELIELGCLESNLNDSPGRKWPEEDVKETTRQILEGLEIMHEAKIAHRDLKPQNILVVSKQPSNIQVKIADFGVSKRLSDRGTTVLATFAGTLNYKAPEVIQRWRDELEPGISESYTFKVDLWSLGCIIFRMLEGRELFPNGKGIPKGPQTNEAEELDKNLDLIGEIHPGVRFAKDLLRFKGEERPSATEALSASWMVG